MLRQLIQLGLIAAFGASVCAEGVVSLGVAQKPVHVSSIKELRQVMTRGHQQITMAPGAYVVSDLLDLAKIEGMPSSPFGSSGTTRRHFCSPENTKSYA